jgi:phosphate transport system substrate-binding protein
MKKSALIAMFVLAVGIGSPAAQEKVVVGGSGALTDEMQELAKAYMAKHPSDNVQVLMDSMSTTGGMEGVKIGRLTIGLVTREPRGAEKEKLVYRGVGRIPVAVGVNKALPIGTLTESQICDIFGGKIKSWKDVGGGDAKITVVTRKSDDAYTEVIRAKMACFKSLQITGDAIALVRGDDVVDALNNRPGTAAIIAVNANLAQRPNAKALAIGGVPPSPEAVQTGKYGYYNEKGIVTLGAPQGAAKRFLDFVAGPEGAKILSQQGTVPVK